MLLLVLAVAFASGGPEAGTPADAEAGASRLRSFLQNVETFRANFRQEVHDGSGVVVEESSGRVVMARPGQFRWDYLEPFERVIVADGERIWLYETDLDQVTVRRLGEGLGDTPAALLTGEVDVLQRFRVERAWRENDMDWVRLAPIAADTDFSSVALGFRQDQLVSLALDDRLGQRTVIHFSDVLLNAPVATGTFTFAVPAGVDVIDDTSL